MKKITSLFAIIFFASCSDGDLEIEVIDFDDITVETCEIPTENTQIFFKRNDTEALVLTLQSGVLSNGIVGDTAVVATTSTIPGQSQLVYRIFNDAVTTNYFCDDIPPIAPIVIEEVEAEDGTVIVETKSTADSTAFEHTIKLMDVTLINSKGERITDLTINEFGEITTNIN